MYNYNYNIFQLLLCWFYAHCVWQQIKRRSEFLILHDTTQLDDLTKYRNEILKWKRWLLAHDQPRAISFNAILYNYISELKTLFNQCFVRSRSFVQIYIIYYHYELRA